MRAFPFRRKWSNAVRTPCPCGRTHASKMEARVCARLRAELAPGARLYQQVRFPLLSIDRKADGSPETICIDFVLVSADGSWKGIDAKSPGRVSRDWRLRAAAFTAFYRVALVETDR